MLKYGFIGKDIAILHNNDLGQKRYTNLTKVGMAEHGTSQIGRENVAGRFLLKRRSQ